MKKNRENMINSTMNVNGRSKGKKGLLITIVVIIFVLLIIGFVLMYTLTNNFKSNKEMFFEYASENFNQKEDSEDSGLERYFNKKMSTPYTNEGIYTTNISSPNENYDGVNDFNISFSGKTDKPNSRADQEISLNYSDELNFPINYKRIDNIIGLQSDKITKNCIAFETDKISEVLGQSNSSDSDVDESSNKILEILSQSASDVDETSEELGEPSFILTQEEEQHIQNEYINVILEKLDEDKFTKTEEGYKLTLSAEDLNNISIQILETLKDDDMMLDKINEIAKIKEKITSSKIQDLIDEINKNVNENNATMELTAYKGNGISLKIKEEEKEVSVEFKKVDTADNLQYNIFIGAKDNTEGTDENIQLKISYSGLSEMQSVNENYELSIDLPTEDSNIQTVHTFDNTVNFEDEIEIDDFDKKNSILLTNYGQEEVLDFLMQVEERAINVNTELMKEAKIDEDKNPILYSIPFMNYIIQPLGQQGLLENHQGLDSEDIQEENQTTQDDQEDVTKNENDNQQENQEKNEEQATKEPQQEEESHEIEPKDI